MTKINLGGLKLAVKQNATPMNWSSLSIVNNKAQKDVSEDKRTNLFDWITKPGQQDKYKLLSPSVSSPDDLCKTHDSQMVISAMAGHFNKMDTAEIFIIAFPRIWPKLD